MWYGSERLEKFCFIAVFYVIVVNKMKSLDLFCVLILYLGQWRGENNLVQKHQKLRRNIITYLLNIFLKFGLLIVS